MPRALRLTILAAINWAFWAVMFTLTWRNLIPERWTAVSFVLSQVFAWPIGTFCCSLWLLINAQIHETGWRLWLTVASMLANGFGWAWLIDLLWCRLTKSGRGFDVIEVPPAG